MNLYLAGEHPVKNGTIAVHGGGNTLSSNHITIAGIITSFLS